MQGAAGRKGGREGGMEAENSIFTHDNAARKGRKRGEKIKKTKKQKKPCACAFEKVSRTSFGPC